MADGHLLSWSEDNTLRLWDSQCGKCLEVIQEHEVAVLHPEWEYLRFRKRNPACVSGEIFLVDSGRMERLCHSKLSTVIAAWNAEAGASVHYLMPDGTAVVTQENGQVCILKLYIGSQRMSLAELETQLSGQI